jgi:hypothetical protein
MFTIVAIWPKWQKVMPVFQVPKLLAETTILGQIY